jgi:hypothetical protein
MQDHDGKGSARIQSDWNWLSGFLREPRHQAPCFFVICGQSDTGFSCCDSIHHCRRLFYFWSFSSLSSCLCLVILVQAALQCPGCFSVGGSQDPHCGRALVQVAGTFVCICPSKLSLILTQSDRNFWSGVPGFSSRGITLFDACPIDRREGRFAIKVSEYRTQTLLLALDEDGGAL